MGATYYGHTETARLLLEAQAEVNAKDSKYGKTALMWAARDGHTETVRLLLEAQAEVNAKDNASYTALMWAASWGPTETVRPHRAVLLHRVQQPPRGRGPAAPPRGDQMSRGLRTGPAVSPSGAAQKGSVFDRKAVFSTERQCFRQERQCWTERQWKQLILLHLVAAAPDQ
eukprot:SAG22_NODE_1079_length_5672_cov_4.668222_2_plen_171_part_00